MRTLSRTLKAIVLLAATLLLLVDRGRDIHAQSPALSWDGLLEHVTAPTDFISTGPNGSSHLPRHAISADGRYVVFTSDATNIGVNYPSILLRDRDTGEVQPLIPGNVSADNLAISGDGSQIAFQTCDPAWRPDFMPICDIRVFNWQTNSLHAMSVALDGTFGAADSSHPVLSANGRFVVFRTNASNLLPPGAAPGQLVIRDRDADGNGIFDEPGTEIIEVVSAANGSNIPGNDVSDGAEVSDDGRYVAFRSMARHLDGGFDGNGIWHVFERDRFTHETRLLDRRPTGQPSPFPVDRPEISMSANGRYVAFASPDRFLAGGFPDDMDDAEDVFVYDHDTWVLSRIDLSDGVASAMDVDQPMLTADGRYVAVRAWSQNSAAPWGGLAKTIFVYDRATAISTKVSVLPDGGDLNWHADSPVISADGTVVLFVSKASNPAPGLDFQFDKIFAAVHFDVQPSEIVVPGRGGQGTFTVTTQAHTMWTPRWDFSQCCWFEPESPWWQMVGSGQVTFGASQGNPDPLRRSMPITFASRTVTFTQGVGLSITSVSPSAGPQTGGTVVTIRGSGFEPGLLVWTNGGLANAEFVDDTTIRFTTPPVSQPGLTWVFVQATDGRYASMADAFRYLDITPPQVFYAVQGQLGNNGWYTGDVTVYWGVWDGESQVTSMSGCGTAVVNTDTPGTTLTCYATSEGGTGSNSVTIKRDATPPTIVITQPKKTIYAFGEVVPAVYTCPDALSGSDTCAGVVMPGEPIDTSTIGFDQQFYAWGADKAGNLGWTSTTYDVGAPFCFTPNSAPRAWWRMEGDTNDLSGGLVATGSNLSTDSFLSAITGQGFSFPDRTAGFLQVAPSPRLDFDSALTIALWIKPTAATQGMLVSHPTQYTLQRLADGSITWTFQQNDGGAISATIPGAAPQDVWTHLAVTFDGSVVKTYVNGRPGQTFTRPGALSTPGVATELTIGGANLGTGSLPFIGGLDELQLFDHALSDWELESLYLSANHGLCAPAPTSLAVNMPVVIDYGTTSFFVGVVLMDGNGQAIIGKPLTLSSGGTTTTLVTDANGIVSWEAPANFGAPGTYPNAFSAVFEGDTQYQRSTISRDITVQKLTPIVTWPTPADITYGAPLGAAQLNATAGVAGTFAYTPSAGTVLGSGAQTLSVTFHPADTANYNDVTISVVLNVQKAVPAMSVTGGSFTYDGQPHAASASASDYLGQPLTPVTITYNGSSSAPVNAGTYNAVASFTGDANHQPRSLSATITIAKATPTVAWPAPGPITYGTALNPAQLNATANVPGTFSYAPAAGTRLPAGTGFTLSATFAPADAANYNNATASRSIDVLRAPLFISVVNTAKVFGSPLPTFAAIGTEFVNGDSMASLAGSLVFNTAATTASPVGSYPVTVGGVSSPNYSITFVAGILTVTQAGSAVAAGSSANPSGFNQGVTFNATASVLAPGAGTPTGTFEFRDGSTRLGTVALVNGAASLTTNGLSAGSHTISAVYGGDANVAGSVQSFTQVVLASAQSSTTALSSSSNPSTAGASVTLTATVTAPTGLTGDVAFYDGATLIGTAALSATRARLVISTLTIGTHAITARYLGNGTIPPSISPVFAQVVKPSGNLKNSTATVVASPSPSPLDQAVTLTATISGNQSTPPTGVVVFFVDGLVVSGQVTLSPFGNASSRATFTTSTLAHGVHNVEVAYLGDGTYKGDAATTTLAVN